MEASPRWPPTIDKFKSACAQYGYGRAIPPHDSYLINRTWQLTLENRAFIDELQRCEQPG